MIKLMKIKEELERISENAYKQGKTDKQVKQLISVYLTESKKKIDSDDLIF